MKVAVCDDNLAFLDEMKDRLGEEASVSEVIVFSDPEKLMTEMKNENSFELVFMDLEFEQKETGFDYGEKMITFAPDLPVIFITGYNDRFAQHLLLTKSNLLGYITKPVDGEILKRYLQKAVNYHSAHSQYFTVSLKNRKVSLKTDEIIYIESDNHKVTIYTETENFTIYQKLSELAKELPDSFIQCHKSFLVNMEWISSVEYKSLLLRGGIQLPVSRTYRENVQNTFFKFLRNKV